MANVDEMLASMPAPMLKRWRVYFALKDSDANPELTEWDTEATAQRKMSEKAARAAAASANTPHKR